MNLESISYIKAKQKEHKIGSDAYNVLRNLEEVLPNIIKRDFKILSKV